MAQTILTLGQLIHWKLNGFVQLDLFPEELEQAKHEQDYMVWEAIDLLDKNAFINEIAASFDD
jgi:hypothetical protein